MRTLKDQNWVLYYSLISQHLKELIPIIYTPTQAEAIANYSHLFRRSEGLYLTFNEQDTMERDYLEQTRGRDVDLIVCSDAEAILGIGDQGHWDMHCQVLDLFVGIFIVKRIYLTSCDSLIGGIDIDPFKCLPVALDVGTDNQELLGDHLYVGWPQKRVRGEKYDQFIDQFVQIVRKYHPHSLLHFEDFGVTNAHRLLERYRPEHACFNDDIQGTGAVSLSCIMAAVGVTKSKLCDQRIVVYGAGSAGLGIAHQLRDAMVATDGVSPSDASRKFYLLDKYGLVKESLGPSRIRDSLYESGFVSPDVEWETAMTNEKGEVGLLEVVKRVNPTIMIGCSTQAGAFTEEVVRTMGQGCERPIILALSNPSRLVEVDPANANLWTDGRALMATGSPFPPARMPNGKDYHIAECNNALIYPGLGFGAVLCQSRRMTDTMIIAGAQRLASLSPALKDPDDSLLPDFDDAPKVNFEIGVAVAEQAIEEGSAGVDWKKSEVRQKAAERLWRPVYGEYIYDPEGEQA
ncbi:NAD-dependent malic enzyme, mitochondrial [Pleurotus pulmonarius]|nr:NAD-dependent malic enzyme, mitochondrial [Pleurotus pulmonarius]